VRQPVPFGKYLLLDRISVGGMAEVFKAKSYGVEGFEKIIAIKRILPTMGEDRDFIKMFIDEAKIAGQLAHANICQIFELGRIDGSHFIAMEYIWGKDLLQIQNRLRKIKQPMPIQMACFSIAKVLEGLDYAHRKRDPLGRPLEIVHRDCSPQNVLVSYEGEVKVIDFGIAKATSRNSRTMAGVLKGKFGYMSPEQVRGLPLDRRSDIFALGTMLYECLTGDRLFQGETDFSTLEKVRNVDIRPPRELNPAIPEPVEAVILKALSKDVDERYQWCSEMLADLQAWLMSQEVVFTAKSLSSWLKEVFAAEIDRERAMLEDYKKLGRDGLIAGVPAAESKADVVATFGEAGPTEGDPTMLGGPSFEDMEAAAGASPQLGEVGPAPGSPAARGAPLHEDDDDGAFGEEAPTEIFGEIDHGAVLAAVAPAGAPRAQTSQPLTRPPKPPPTHRPPTSREAPAAAPPPQSYAPSPSTHGYGNSVPYAQQQPPAVTPSSQPIAVSTHGGTPNGPAQNQGRTLLGAVAPAGLPNYAQGYPPQLQQPQPPPMQHSQPMPLSSSQPLPGPGPGMHQPSQQVPTMLQGPPSGPMPQHMQQQPMQGYPPHMQQQQPMQGYPPHMQQQPMQGMPPHMHTGQMQPMQPMQGYPGQQYAPNPYAPSAVHQIGAAVEQTPGEKKKSSIARDVAIGVAIAALVLGGFLVVKFLILDGDPPSEPAPPPSSIATIHLSITPGVSAELFVDDKKIATVADSNEIPVTAGTRKVKLVGPNGTGCEKEMTLAAGKTTPLECAMTPPPPPPPAPGSASPPATDSAGSAAPPAVDSGAAAGSGSGSAAAAAVVPDTADKMPPEDHAKPADKVIDKPADKPADKPIDKPADHVVAKPVDGAADKKPRPRPAADDDLGLGKLSGGTKPGDKKPETKRPESLDDPSLKPLPKQAADAKGYLSVTSKPSAKIAIDGVDTGLATPITGRGLPVSAGKHKVTFAVGNDKFTFWITVKPGESLSLHKDLQ
jgi:hypothetical protein